MIPLPTRVYNLIKAKSGITTKEICEQLQDQQKVEVVQTLIKLEFIGIIESNSRQEYKIIGW